jgi:hypothetical protein
VVDPAQHADSRNLVESMLRNIPGFRGYLEKEYRRESDDLAREFSAHELQRCKASLDNYQRTLLDAGQIDSLPLCERVRNHLDTLQSKIRGAVQGYSGFFDFVRVDNKVLDDVYEHDLAIVEDVRGLFEMMEQLPGPPEAPSQALADVQSRLDALARRVDERSQILQGLS